MSLIYTSESMEDQLIYFVEPDHTYNSIVAVYASFDHDFFASKRVQAFSCFCL